MDEKVLNSDFKSPIISDDEHYFEQTVQWIIAEYEHGDIKTRFLLNINYKTETSLSQRTFPCVFDLVD